MCSPDKLQTQKSMAEAKGCKKRGHMKERVPAPSLVNSPATSFCLARRALDFSFFKHMKVLENSHATSNNSDVRVNFLCSLRNGFNKLPLNYQSSADKQKFGSLDPANEVWFYRLIEGVNSLRFQT